MCCPKVNEVGLKAVKDNLIDGGNIIARIEQHFPYIRYDYIKKEFKIYGSKIYQTKQAHSDNRDVRNSAWQRMNGYDYSNLPVAKWFPESEIEFMFTPPAEQREENFKERTAAYLKKKRYLRKSISREEKGQILQAIIQIAQECRYDKVRKDARSLGSVLRKAGYRVEQKNGHGNKYEIVAISDRG